jgi:hypothetical protein
MLLSLLPLDYIFVLFITHVNWPLKLQLGSMVLPAALLGLRTDHLRLGHRFPASLWGLVGVKTCLLVYIQLHPLPGKFLSLANTFSPFSYSFTFWL